MRPGLTIGDFAQVTHLSVRTLRRYHERALLEPAVVDPDSWRTEIGWPIFRVDRAEPE